MSPLLSPLSYGPLMFQVIVLVVDQKIRDGLSNRRRPGHYLRHRGQTMTSNDSSRRSRGAKPAKPYNE
jgi:hypothetical protein